MRYIVSRASRTTREGEVSGWIVECLYTEGDKRRSPASIIYDTPEKAEAQANKLRALDSRMKFSELRAS